MKRSGQFDVIVERDGVVEVRDGTTLMTDVYRPAADNQPLAGPLPTVLSRTPLWQGPLESAARHLAGHGYGVAFQDWRAQAEFDSGQFRPRHEATDGYPSHVTLPDEKKSGSQKKRRGSPGPVLGRRLPGLP